jgi:DNA-binding PadR family transcriptional regulator
MVSPRRRAVGADSVPATGWAVLGLLSFGRELSGYDLKKWADHSLRFFYWSPAISQIYSELKRLERLGYVSSRTVAQDELRNKRVYAITDSGAAALTEWVQHAPVEPPVLKHSVAMRVWLGHLADPDELRTVVERHRDYAEAMLSDVTKSVEKSEPTSEAGFADEDPARVYPQVVIRWGEEYYRAERDLAQQMLKDLDHLATRRRTAGAGVAAGLPDAGPPDAGPQDAGPPDAGPPDAGPPDAGPTPLTSPSPGPVEA